MKIRNSSGFTLIETMITVGIIAILAAIAIPSYMSYMVTSRRAAAEACLSNYADYMERFYATNMSYYQDTSGNLMSQSTLTALNLDCATPQNTGTYYVYNFSGTITQSTFTLEAQPQGTQLAHDKLCATLTLNQLGQRGETGTAGTSTNSCWQH
jgi:type IV pilus assembly protein PilE